MQRTGTISPMWLCQHNKWYCEKCTLTVLMDPIPHQHEYRQNHPSSKHCDKPYTGSCSPWKRLPLMALLVHPTVAVTLSLLLWNKVVIVYVYVVVEVAVSSFHLITSHLPFPFAVSSFVEKEIVWVSAVPIRQSCESSVTAEHTICVTWISFFHE